MSHPLISVIVPAYNIEPHLPRTLDALLAQTYPNIEIIVVNDGSTDGTARIIDAYTDKYSRIKAIHKENGGVTSARLRGVRESAGEWIAFCDGDDFPEPEMYEHLLKNALNYHADISHCGYQMVLPSGRIRYYYNTGSLTVQEHDAGLRDLLEGRFVEPGLWNKLCSRGVLEAFLETVPFDTTIRINEDLLMNYYLFRLSSRSVHEDICPYHYVVRQTSAANAPLNEAQLRDPLKVRQILFRETEASPDLHTIAGNHLIRHLVMLSTMCARKNRGLILPVRKDARKELRRMLRTGLRNCDCSKKMKLMALWAAVWPGSYALVHRLYEKITGLDKIYEK